MFHIKCSQVKHMFLNKYSQVKHMFHIKYSQVKQVKQYCIYFILNTQK